MGRSGWSWGVVVWFGCTSAAHDHSHDAGDHHVRDPATEPCDAGNWASLYPDLRDCDLAGVVLDNGFLRRADLTGANLTGASLANADLFTATLVAATAADIRLDGAKLTAVDATGADLTRASLRGAVLFEATLADALLDGAITDATTTCPTGQEGPCW